MKETIKRLKTDAIHLDRNIRTAIRMSNNKQEQEALEKAADFLVHQVIEFLRTAEQVP